MKKHLLLFAFSVLALNSCKEDDVFGYELDMLKGNWKTEKTEIISGADNTTVLNTDIKKIKNELDATHYGLVELKERICEYAYFLSKNTHSSCN